MAIVLHTATSPWVSRGTSRDGESMSSSARAPGSWLSTDSTVKSMPENRQSSQPRSDQAP